MFVKYDSYIILYIFKQQYFQKDKHLKKNFFPLSILYPLLYVLALAPCTELGLSKSWTALPLSFKLSVSSFVFLLTLVLNALAWKFKSVSFRIVLNSNMQVYSKFLHISYFLQTYFILFIWGIIYSIAFIIGYKILFLSIVSDTFIAIYQTNIIRKYTVIITCFKA